MGAVLASLARWFLAPPDATGLPHRAHGPALQDGDAEHRATAADAGAVAAGAVRWLAPSPLADRAHRTSPVPRTPAIAVLALPKDLRVAGAAAALGALHLSGRSCGLIAEWTGSEPNCAPDKACSPTARRLAVGLRADGHAAQAAGRLVRLALPADEAVAAQALRGLGSDTPAVLALAGPRGPALSAALTASDVVLLVTRPGTDAELAMLAVADLALAGAHVRTLELAASPGAALLARSGIALSAPLRAPLLAAIGARAVQPAGSPAAVS